MDDLQARHELLLTTHRPVLSRAADRFRSEITWSLDTTAALLWQRDTQRSVVGPVGQLGRWIDHLGPDLDAFVRLRQQGMATDSAYRLCLEHQGMSFQRAWEDAQEKHPLVTHDDLSSFAVLSQQGFGRDPRGMLVVVHWIDRVTAFLVSGERLQKEPTASPSETKPD
jgi:hypothetical protein